VAFNAIAGTLDVWEIHPDAGWALVAANAAQYARLARAGYRMQPVADTARILAPHAALDPRYYYFDDHVPNPQGRYVVDALQSITTTHPTLTELIDIGDAWQGQHGGHPRDLWVLRITNEDPAYGDIAAKPPFFLFATVHAREISTAELAMRYIRYLTEGYDGAGGYGIDPDVTWLVNHHVIYVEVMANPDGHAYNEADTGSNHRKNMNGDHCGTGNLGVDLNRNSSFYWNTAGTSPDPCNDMYPGPSAASEPETQAFEAFFPTVFQDFNGPNDDNTLPPPAYITTTGVFITLHSYGDWVLWPWGQIEDPAPDDAGLRTIGRKFAYYNGHTPAKASALYPVSGATDDWTYGRFGVPSYTFEVGTGGGPCGGFFCPYECVDGDGTYRDFWGENRPAFVYAHKVARAPYAISYGPDTEDVRVIGGAVDEGTPLQVSATLADRRYPGDPLHPITAAEYALDAPIEGGSGISMTASAGWGRTVVTVTAPLNTWNLTPGQHYVLVQAQNDAGDWGPPTAAFFYVTDTAQLPALSGYVRDTCTNVPLTATVSAGDFHVGTDADAGFYAMHVLSDTYTVEAHTPGYTTTTITQTLVNDETAHVTFYLTPLTAANTVLSDDVESGSPGWTATGHWIITDAVAHSPTHAWRNLPQLNEDATLTSPSFDLSDYAEVTLHFWHTYDLLKGWDYGYIETSSDGGVTWTPVTAYSDEGHTTWEQASVDLSTLTGQADARFRFRLSVNPWLAPDGWALDDIVLTGRRAVCATPWAPRAHFTSASPGSVGVPLTFTNRTTGTVPITYTWAFGDGVTATQIHPAHSYAAPGDYTVWLTATNAYGTHVVSSTVSLHEVMTWTGNTSAAWGVAANWSSGKVPTATDDIVIPSTPAGARWPTLSGAAYCHDVQVQAGAQMTLTHPATLTIEGEIRNRGRLRQIAPVSPSTGPVAFLAIQNAAGDEKYAGVVISPTGEMGTVHVDVWGVQTCGENGTLRQSVRRCFAITPEITRTAVITFAYQADEANGNTNPRAYRYAGDGQWTLLAQAPGSPMPGVEGRSVAQGEAYGLFALADLEVAPTMVHLQALKAQQPYVLAGLLLGLVGLGMGSRRATAPAPPPRGGCAWGGRGSAPRPRGG
jgi:PKD repeat protein